MKKGEENDEGKKKVEGTGLKGTLVHYECGELKRRGEKKQQGARLTILDQRTADVLPLQSLDAKNNAREIKRAFA